MAARDRAEGIGAGQDRQAEGERYAGEADPQIWKGRSKNRAAAPAESKPECAEKFRRQLLAQ